MIHVQAWSLFTRDHPGLCSLGLQVLDLPLLGSLTAAQFAVPSLRRHAIGQPRDSN